MNYAIYRKVLDRWRQISFWSILKESKNVTMDQNTSDNNWIFSLGWTIYFIIKYKH